MKNRFGVLFTAFIACGILLSCNPIAGPFWGATTDIPAVQRVPYTGTFPYTVDPGTSAKDVYFVFTNTDLTKNASTKPSVTSSVITVDGVALPTPSPQPMYSFNSAPNTTMERIAEFNRNPFSYFKTPTRFQRPKGFISDRGAETDTVGDVDDIVTDINLTTGARTVWVNATCRYVTGPVNLGDGRTRSLSIWVDTLNWDATEADPTKMSPIKVEALADRFLQSPASLDDIYHWDTAAVGEPWSSTIADPALIDWDPNNTITILLANLNTVYTGAVTVGYFWSKDQLTGITGSNQRVMFYLDATLYGTLETGETTWAETNYWPMIIYSTLAHEFQHMIQFYQKAVLKNAGGSADSWIDEMCSMIMEDLVADKLGIDGPRGVFSADAGTAGNTQGRIPDFNRYSYYPLAVANPDIYYGDVTNYSVSYTFGAWLARNYGGAEVLKNIVQSALTDSAAVVEAAAAYSGRQDEDMAALLEKWASAVLLSSLTTAPSGYRYNTGDWITSTSGGESYNLGSINIFNYSPTLKVFTGPGNVPSTPFIYASNVYYQAADGLKAPKTWTVTLPQGIAMSVVVK
jgi:hypothetical protein